MSGCPDSGSGWHDWQFELVPTVSVFALEVGEVQRLPYVVTCRLCGAVQ